MLVILFLRMVIGKIAAPDLSVSCWQALGPIGTCTLALLLLGNAAPFVLAGTPANPLAETELAPQALREATWIMRERGSGTRSLFEAELQRRGVDPTALRTSIELPSNESVLTAVQAGGGVAVISDLAARQKDVAIVDLAMPQRRFTVMHHRERSPSRAQQALLAVFLS